MDFRMVACDKFHEKHIKQNFMEIAYDFLKNFHIEIRLKSLMKLHTKILKKFHLKFYRAYLRSEI